MSDKLRLESKNDAVKFWSSQFGEDTLQVNCADLFSKFMGQEEDYVPSLFK